MPRRHRLTIVCSHPIQYLAPWFRHLAAQPTIDLTVLYGDDQGVGAHVDPDFNRPITWDVDLLSGYRHVFLRNHALRRGVGHFAGIVSLDLFSHLQPAHCDAVLIQGWNYALYPLAQQLCVRRRIPLFLRCESGLPLTPTAQPPPSLRARLRNTLLRAYVKSCTAGLYVSSANRRLLAAQGLPPERLFFSPYAVEAAHFALPDAARLAARQRLRAALRVPPHKPLFLFVGKLIDIKEPLLLLAAWADLKKTGTEAHLCLVGDGPLRAALTAYSIENALTADLTFAGFQNQAALPDYYAAADVLVLPSRSETFGIVVLEAMHAGLPVIASAGVGAAEDLVLPGRTGAVFPTGDRAALCQAMHTLAAPSVRAKLSPQARAHSATFSYAEATRGLLSALGTLPSPAQRA